MIIAHPVLVALSDCRPLGQPCLLLYFLMGICSRPHRVSVHRVSGLMFAFTAANPFSDASFKHWFLFIFVSGGLPPDTYNIPLFAAEVNNFYFFRIFNYTHL